MYNADSDWLLSGVVNFEPDPEDRLPPVQVTWASQAGSTRFLAQPENRVGIEGFDDFTWMTSLIPAREACMRLFYRSTDGPGHVPFIPARDFASVDSILREVRVPVYGSPPKDWTTVMASISSGGLSSGAVAYQEGGPYVAVLVGIGVTLFMTAGVPIARGVGEGVEFKIKRALGIPTKFLKPKE